MKKSYSLKSIDEDYPDVEFTFNYRTKLFSGKDASMLQDILNKAILNKGFATRPPVNFYFFHKKVTEADLGVFFESRWDVFGQLLPDDEYTVATLSIKSRPHHCCESLLKNTIYLTRF